jgi:hemoglobin-like flavoprotein
MTSRAGLLPVCPRPSDRGTFDVEAISERIRTLIRAMVSALERVAQKHVGLQILPGIIPMSAKPCLARSRRFWARLRSTRSWRPRRREYLALADLKAREVTIYDK